MTDFEHGLQGTTIGYDTVASTGTLFSARSFHGNFSLKLNPSADANSYVNWGRVLHFVRAGNVGFEYSISLDAHPEVVKTYVFYHEGDDIYEASLHYYPDTGLWRVIEDGPAWVVVLEEYKLQTVASTWHPVKLVLDLDKKEYVRAQIGQYVENLEGYAINKYGGALLGQLETRVQVHGQPATHAAVYLDGVIVTQGEP